MVKLERPAGRLRPALPEDEASVRWITDEVFTVFGEYGSWLPGYLRHPGVWTYVYEVAGQVVAFAMLGVLEPDVRGGTRVADLLAIAVAPEHQGRGMGKALLERVSDKALALARRMRLTEVRLTVADSNERARRLFARHGFVPVGENHGRYERGQRALRLCLALVRNEE